MPGHKFDPGQGGFLDSPLRRRMVPADQILQSIAPSSHEVWAEVGCGTGLFTLPLARLVADLRAMDISTEMLAKLKSKLQADAVKNIEVLLAGESTLPLKDTSIDGLFMAFVAHELDDPAGTMREVARCLRPGGRLVIVEHARVDSPGPPLSHRLAEDQVDAWATAAGLAKSRAWQWSEAVVGWEYIKA